MKENFTPRPPQWAERLLARIAAPHLREELQGDLEELFRSRLQRYSYAQARLLYLLDLLLLLHPRLFRQQTPGGSKARNAAFNQPPHPLSVNQMMLRSYLIIACRNIARSKSFSAITVLGLALGLACSLFIYLWVSEEVKMDAYHTNGPHLYRIMERVTNEGKPEAFPETRWPIALELPRKFPEIVHAAGFAANQAQLVFTVGEKTFKETGDWAGRDWFNMFSVPLLAGSAEGALAAPNSLAISRRLAGKYFSSPQAALGKTIRIENKDTYQVTAVFEDLPPYSSLQYDFLLSWEDFRRRNSWAIYWEAQNPQAFLQLRPDTDVAAFGKKLKHFLRLHHRGIDPKHLERYDVELFLQPFEEMYLYSKTENGQIVGGRVEYVRLFSVVAVFILLIACINFTNLATARSARRAKEVGIRKAVGANRLGVMSQFLTEAMLMTLMAGLLAFGLVALLLPAFNQLTGKAIALPLTQPAFLGIAILALAGTGLLSGSYPALFLSSLQPIQVLKGKLQFNPGSSRLRQGLVVVQFSISLLLISSTLVVYRQVTYIQTKNLGFDRENLISVPLEGSLLAKYSTLKQELGRMPGVQGVTRMSHQPTNIGSITSQVEWTGKDPTLIPQFTHVSVGYDLLKVLKIKLLEGRAFSPRFSTDSVGFVINKQAAKLIGYHNSIGQPLTLDEKKGTIIGLVEDFHFQSLHEPIKPLIMSLNENDTYGHLLVRSQPGQTRQALSSLEMLCKQINPTFPFTYSFVDSDYKQLYQSEQVVGSLTNYFAVLAIFIACLGLFG